MPRPRTFERFVESNSGLARFPPLSLVDGGESFRIENLRLKFCGFGFLNGLRHISIVHINAQNATPRSLRQAEMCSGETDAIPSQRSNFGPPLGHLGKPRRNPLRNALLFTWVGECGRMIFSG
jgi:hypothetical protein